MQDLDNHLRPGFLEEFIGQKKIKNNLQVFLDSAKKRQTTLDHTIFYGPPGLGKTTLAQVIAREMGSNFRATSGPVLSKGADLAAILTNLKERDVLFIDEIHRLPISVEEMLYSAMEDQNLDIMIGDGPMARTVKLGLPKFTLVGATTRIGLLSNPLRDRFGIPLRLEFYDLNDLMQVIVRAAGIMQINLTQDAAIAIARRARGTPRIALRLLRRVLDFATVKDETITDVDTTNQALNSLEVDAKGLDVNDMRYLRYIQDYYKGGPVGVDTIAAGLSEHKDTIEDTIEPYLMQIGFLQRTPRGRQLTQSAMEYLLAIDV